MLPSKRSGMGFSLLELMIVMVIIGVMTSVAAFSLGTMGGDMNKKPLQKLRFGVELMSNEAIIRSEMLALGFFDRGYVYFRMDEESERWELIEGDRLLKPYEFAGEEPLPVQVYIEGEQQALSGRGGVEPQIFAMPTGEVTPFEYHLYNPNFETDDVLKFDALGRASEEVDPDSNAEQDQNNAF